MRGHLAALGVAAACLCAPSAHAQTVYDPYEGMNRNLFAAHEAVDHAVLEPVAQGYRAVTTQGIRNSVTNFLHNLKSPVILANDVLQAQPTRAGTTIARFGINTTIGVLGLFDPAEHMGLEEHDEDFGQTLAVWGVHPGPYFFIPVLGPTNLRDGAGQIVDLAFDPLNYAEFDHDDAARISRGLITGISTRESLIETVDGVRENSVDPYVTFRSSYSLVRESAIRNGPMNVQDLPEFDAIPEDQGNTTDPSTPPADPSQAPAVPSQPAPQPAAPLGVQQ